MDHHVIQTNSGAEAVFWTMVWNPVTFKEELSALRETLIKAGRHSRVLPTWLVVVCTSAEHANCVAQMGPLNMAEPLSDGYIVQAQSAND